MDMQTFENTANETLEKLFEALDSAIGDQVDVDFEDSILMIELEDGRQYVINKHSPSQEIWLSSPVGGASHYRYDLNSNVWLSTRGGESLLNVLSQELSKINGDTVAL